MWVGFLQGIAEMFEDKKLFIYVFNYMYKHKKIYDLVRTNKESRILIIHVFTVFVLD